MVTGTAVSESGSRPKRGRSEFKGFAIPIVRLIC